MVCRCEIVPTALVEQLLFFQSMNKMFVRFLKCLPVWALCVMLWSCADHDDPQLAPIDTTQVRISATVKDAPNSSWLNVTEELIISVENVEMTAPKGVVLRSISLFANNGMSRYELDEKPFSGEPLVFRVPLTGIRGRVNFSLRGNLIKKDSRDAEIIIDDNIQQIVFSQSPEFECQGQLQFMVKSKSTSGEEYSHSFKAVSSDHFTIPVSRSELYWTPTSGSASTLEVSISSGALAWSPNTTFECAINRTAIGQSSGDGATVKFSIPNTPGALDELKLKLYVLTSYFGTWEDVTINPYNLINVFDIVERE